MHLYNLYKEELKTPQHFGTPTIDSRGDVRKYASAEEQKTRKQPSAILILWRKYMNFCFQQHCNKQHRTQLH